MQIKVRRLRVLWGPDGIGVPRIRSALERIGLPRRFLASSVQIIAKEWRFDILPEFARGFVSAKWDQANAIAFRRLPFSVEPRSGDDEIGMLRVVFFGVAKNLPGSPRVFLIPESGDVQIRYGRRMQLANPCFLLPKIIVIWMVDAGIPVRNGAMQIFRIDVGERSQIEIPLVRIVGFEIEMRVLVLIGLLHDGVFEVVALAQRTVAMVVIV